MLYAKLAAALVFVVIVIGAYIKGRTDGGDIVRGEYAARDAKAASDYAAKERELTEANRQKERQWAKSAAQASAKYQREIAANETQRLADRAAIESGAIRLRDPGTADHKAAGSEACAVAGTSGGRDGGAETGLQAASAGVLSAKASEFILDIANQCDAVVNQLSAAQRILRAERQ